MGTENEWAEWSRYVLEAISEMRDQIRTIHSRIDDTRSSLLDEMKCVRSEINERVSKEREELRMMIDRLSSHDVDKLRDNVVSLRTNLEVLERTVKLKVGWWGVIASSLPTLVALAILYFKLRG
jgi:dsDNA-specific endonuclease/ATPase MutS2